MHRMFCWLVTARTQGSVRSFLTTAMTIPYTLVRTERGRSGFTCVWHSSAQSTLETKSTWALDKC